MILKIRLLTLALTIAFVLLLPLMASAQGFGAGEDNIALQGTTLTYHPRSTVGQCQADCANNPNCKGFTWIQAGTYNAGDQAMCYLMSAVTGRTSSRGHISAVKSSGASVGAIENNTALQGTNLTYYQRPNVGQCQADCANNPNCKGFTWIQAGTYNAGDPAMCYLMSAVTGRVANRGHISAVKETAGGGGGTLSGSWEIKCCNDELGWTVSLTTQDGATFSGSFSANTGGGFVTNGRVRGNTIEFDRSERIDGGWRQHWSAQLVNDGGRLKMINGVWTGDYLDRYPGRNNWHAEKK